MWFYLQKFVIRLRSKRKRIFGFFRGAHIFLPPFSSFGISLNLFILITLRHTQTRCNSNNTTNKMYGNNVRTTETDTNFVANYTEKTRLGFIGTRDSQNEIIILLRRFYLLGGPREFIFLLPLCCALPVFFLMTPFSRSLSLSFIRNVETQVLRD